MTSDSASVSDEKFSSRVSLNLITNVIRTGIMAVIGLLMVPYYIDQLGLATYAVLPLATSITTYVLVASNSLAESFARYLVLAMHKGDRHEIDTIYSSSVIGMLRISLIILPVIILVSLLSPVIFSSGNASSIEVQLMFLMILSSSVIISFVTCYSSVYIACNKLYIIEIVRTIYCVSQVVLVMSFFFIFGPSLIYLGLSFLIASIIFLVCLLIGIRKIEPALKVHRSNYDRASVRTMIKLGMWSMMCKLGDILFIEASLILTNIFLGSAVQGEFSIVASITSMISTVCIALSTAGVPLTYKSYGEGNMDELMRTLSLFIKFVGATMAFLLAFLCIFPEQILVVWLGESYPSVVTMICLMVPICVSRSVGELLTHMPILFARIKEMAIATCAIGIFNIVCDIVVLSFFDIGVNSVCIIWAISIGLLYLVFYPLYTSKLIGTKRTYFYRPLLISYLLFFILLGIGTVISNFYILPANILVIAVVAIVGFLIYVPIVLRLCFNKNERSILISYLPLKT